MFVSVCPSSWSTSLLNHNVFHPVFPADSGVSSAMQLEEFSNQQNGNYQPNLEPVSAVRLIYSPSALVESQLPQGLNQQLAPAPDGNYIQASTQSEDSVLQQTAARLHPGTYQQADAQRQPYQSITVSQTFLIFYCWVFINSQFSVTVFFLKVMTVLLSLFLISITAVTPL